MKKLFVASVFLLSMAGYSQMSSQELDQKLRTSKEYKNELSVLKLSLDQESQYFQITKKYVKLNDDLYEQNVSNSEFNKKEDELEDKKYAELKNFLSEEQLANYKKVATERRTANRSKKKY